MTYNYLSIYFQDLFLLSGSPQAALEVCELFLSRKKFKKFRLSDFFISISNFIFYFINPAYNRNNIIHKGTYLP